MPLFAWEARTNLDETRSGELAATSEVEVVSTLRRQGLRVTRVMPRSLRSLPRPAPGVAPGQLAAALRDLLALRSAGLSSSEVLELVSARRRGPLARALRAIKLSVDSGVALGDAFSRHPAALGSLGSRALAHADLRGTIDETLAALIDLLDRTSQIHAGLRRALLQVLAAAAVSLGWLALLSSILAPALRALYERLSIDTSGPARAVFALAPYLSLGTTITAAALALAALAAAVAIRRARRVWSPPVLAERLRRLALARFARALAAALSAGLPRLQALELAAWEADDGRLSEVFLRARDGLAQGVGIGEAMDDPALPRAFTRAVQGAERSGELREVLLRIADIEESAALRWVGSRASLVALLLYGATLVSAALAGLALVDPLLRT